MDKKIQAAAENDMHGYDERSWSGMEQLLNKHLPQKKSRRRIAFFLLFALLLVGVPTFFVLRNTSSNDSTLSSVVEQKTGNKSTTETGSSATQQNPASSSSASNASTEQKTTGTTAADGTTTIDNTNDKSTSADQSLTKTNTVAKNNKTGNQQNQSDKSTKVIVRTTPPATKSTPSVTQPDAGEETSKDIAYIEDPITKTTAPDKAPTSVVTVPAKEPATTDVTASDSKAPVKSELTDSSAKATEEPVVKKEKKKSSFASKFSLSVSAGPDYSSVGSRPGQWKGQYGFGLGYSFSDKWSVRTGFFVARKVYTADTTSYKAPGAGPYNFKLDEIKANCLVYEVPVSVVYNFAKGKNHSWFVSGGLSSYFMKSEKYDYIYKYQTMTQTHKYGFKNENTHLFSILGLSAGYQYNFNRRLSLMAEPYLRLPLSGVGHGSVKLKSAGAMFTLSYKPFGQR